MRFGAMNFPVRPVIQEIVDLGSLGFDYLELAMDAPLAHHQVIAGRKTEILSVLNDFGMGIVCHLPTFVYTADLTPAIRKASLDEIMRSLDVAAELGARKAALHPSIISGLGPYVMEAALECANEALFSIVEHASPLKIALCLENMFPHYHAFYRPEDFSHLFCRFPSLRLTLDTGHANIESDSRNNAVKFIDAYGDRLGHIHLSDNKGKRDDHLPIGKGNIDFKNFVSALKRSGYDDTLTLEIFSDDRARLVESREKFADLWQKTS